MRFKIGNAFGRLSDRKSAGFLDKDDIIAAAYSHQRHETLKMFDLCGAMNGATMRVFSWFN